MLPSTAAPAPQIPPAPPPPPPPSKHKQRSYFERFVAQPLTTAYQARPSSAHASRGLPNPLVPKLPGVRTDCSQDASHKTGLDISALDINRDRTHAVLAGKEILKTVSVHDANIVDQVNLRAAVLNYADSHARQRDGLSIHDVKWSHGHFSAYIATAAANGKVILYDLHRQREITRLHEHDRQVHKLAFNPHAGHLLLSASQDATVRLWDLRDMRRDAAIYHSRDKYLGNNGGVRDVQWSPTDAVEFAFGTDNGNIQRWDFRYSKTAKQKITAHEQRTCTSIDWHPDGKHLLSASVDRTVKIWDFSVDGRRQKAAYTLTTPFPVYRAKWRPPNWSDDTQARGVYQCTQLATSYDREHSVLHVWDFRRPFLPFREINKFSTAPSDMLWHSRDTLWTVGRLGIFQQNDVHHAPKTVDRRNLQALAVSPSGEVGGVAQRRPRHRRSASLVYADDTYVGESRDRHSPAKASMRSSADDTIDQSFLATTIKRHHGRTASNRSTRSFGSTPPSDTAPKVMFLTDSMTARSDYTKPNQLAFRGLLPGVANVQVFAYLAQKYKAISLSDPPDIQSYLEIERVFEQNAEYAERAALYRIAQTWRIIGTSIATTTRKRAASSKKQRRAQRRHDALTSNKAVPKATSDPMESLVERNEVPQNAAVRAIMGMLDKAVCVDRATSIVESTSNLATPLARPLITSNLTTFDNGKTELPDPDHADIIQLPPAVTGPSIDTAGDNRTFAPHFAGPHWYQTADGLNERRALVGNWRASPRVPLSLDSQDSPRISITIPPPLERHDSGDSFNMFSASSESQGGNSGPSSYASVNSQGQSLDSASNLWPIDADKSSFGNGRSNDPQHAFGNSAQISPTTKIGQSIPTQISADQWTGISSGDRAVHEMEHLRRNNQLLRHDSSESEAYASSHGETSSSSFDYNPDMDASGTIVPDGFDDLRSPLSLKPHAPLSKPAESVPLVLDSSSEEAVSLSDFQAMHVDVESGSSHSVIGLLDSLIASHASAQADAQFPSLLLLLLAPLLPQTHDPTDTNNFDVGEVLTTFSDTFLSLGLTPTQAKAVLSTQLSQIIATGINPYQAEAILHAYHAQLHSLSLFNSAASLRRLAYPAYPAVYEQALKDTQLKLLCLSCKSPINNPKDKMRCESCKRAQAPCPICWGKHPAFEPITAKRKAKHKIRSSFKDRNHRRKRSSLMSNQSVNLDQNDEGKSPSVPEPWSLHKATLWTWCPLCGHGGHTNCLSTWFTDTTLSDGACATEGCLCDCVQGKRRNDKIEEILRLKVEKDRSKPVRKGDDWKVNESKAVSAVRGALGDSFSQEPSPAASRKDDGKRVRMIPPGSDLPAPAPGFRAGP